MSHSHSDRHVIQLSPGMAVWVRVPEVTRMWPVKELCVHFSLWSFSSPKSFYPVNKGRHRTILSHFQGLDQQGSLFSLFSAIHVQSKSSEVGSAHAFSIQQRNSSKQNSSALLGFLPCAVVELGCSPHSSASVSPGRVAREALLKQWS